MASTEDKVNSVTVDKVNHLYRKSELCSKRRDKLHLQRKKCTLSIEEAHLQITEFMGIRIIHSVYLTLPLDHTYSENNFLKDLDGTK